MATSAQQEDRSTANTPSAMESEEEAKRENTLVAFTDAIHKLLGARRINAKSDGDEAACTALDNVLSELLNLSAEDEELWKTLLLALIHVRYHVLSPEAQALSRQEDGSKVRVAGGKGERELFYRSVMCLFNEIVPAEEQQQDGLTVNSNGVSVDDATDAPPSTNTASVAPPAAAAAAAAAGRTAHKDMQLAALNVLVRSAPYAGGTRDVCSIIEDMVEYIVNKKMSQTRKEMMHLYGKELLSFQVCEGTKLALSLMHEGPTSLPGLEFLLDLAARTLDHDLEITRRKQTKTTGTTTTGTGASASPPKELPSTLHMYIPHRDRGRPRKRSTKRVRPNTQMEVEEGEGEGERAQQQEERTETTRRTAAAGAAAAKTSSRQIVNAIAEVLIWSRTEAALSQVAFQTSYEQFINSPRTRSSSSNLHTMQTIIRKLRQEINSYARGRGFMLSDQFALDSTALTGQGIRRGKAGDIARLTKLAEKKEAQQILQMIHYRFMSDPSKATNYGSLSELMHHFAEAPAEGSNDEVRKMLRDIHTARVKATVTHLRSLVKAEQKEHVVIASMERSKEGHVTAILAASALAHWNIEDETVEGDTATSAEKNQSFVRIIIGGVEKQIISFKDCMKKLDDAILHISKVDDAQTFMDDDGIATTKAVTNLIDRHLKDNGILLLITSADVRLPQDVMKSLTSRGCSAHCHDVDDIGDRLEREKARAGDVTISLAWDTLDDLDLHVIIPSGEEIGYSNKKSRDGKCQLDVDMNAGGDCSTEPVENVFLGNLDEMVEAPHGNYKVFVQNYSYHTNPPHGNIPFRVVIDKNGEKEKFHGACKGTGDASNFTVCEFKYGGRTVPFPREEKAKSAFGTSTLVNLTASAGQTLEALSQLVQTVQHHKHLDEVRVLVNDDNETTMNVENTEETQTDEEIPSRPLEADSKTLEVTSRDMIFIRLAKLPKRFHLFVGEFFGGPTLAEICAKEVAKRMVADKIPVSELTRKGYPEDIIQAVKTRMATSDVEQND